MVRRGVPDPFRDSGSEPPEPSGFAVIIWAGIAGFTLLLAVVAMLYGLPERQEALTATSPDIDYTTTGTVPGGESVSIMGAGRSDFSMRSDDSTLASEVAALKVENAALRQTLGAMRTQLDMLSDRLARMEGQLGEVTGSVDRTTTSITSRPVAPQPAPAPETGDETLLTRTQFGIELGAYDDLQAVKAAWRKLLDEKPGLFADLDAMATVRDRGGRTELLLVAGPFTNAADAAARCTQVERAELSCLPAFYLGQPLAMR